MTDFEYQKLHNQVQPWDVVADAWLLPRPERRADSQTTKPDANERGYFSVWPFRARGATRPVACRPGA